MARDNVRVVLEEIATGKALKVIDTPTSEDIADLYVAMKKGGITYIRILQLLKKRMGCSVDPATFFSQALVACGKIHEAPYLLYMNNAKAQKNFLQQMRKYFGKLSTEFLRRRLQ